MKCPGCGSDILGGVGARCLRCGYLPKSVAVTPMETVVHASPTHRLENSRRKIPAAVSVLYGSGVLVYALPLSLYFYFRNNSAPPGAAGWRALGMVLSGLLAILAHVLLWASAFFYGRLVTSDQIAAEAERGTAP